MKSNRLDAQDTMAAWMKMVSKKIQQGNRKGRLDVLGSVIEPDALVAGELTVRTMDEIPEGLPLGSPVYVLDLDQVLAQDPTSREWQPQASP